MSNYEMIRYKQGLNANILVHSINRFKLHWHKEIEILLILKGHITVSVNNKRYELKEDDVFLINSNEIHSTMANGDNIMAAIQINPAFYYKTFPELQDMKFMFHGDNGNSMEEKVYEQIRAYMAQIVKEYNKSAEGYQLVIEGILNNLMATIIRHIPKYEQVDGKKDIMEKDLPRIKRIMEYVEEHYSEKITLDHIAKSEFLSSFYISHFFKEKVGLTFQEYLSFIRLHKAVASLDETDKLISQVAIENGFASVKAFNKTFKDFYGITPREYRKFKRFDITTQNDKMAYMEFDSMYAMKKLQDYELKRDGEVVSSTLVKRKNISKCDVSVKGENLEHYWSKLITVGRAFDCLRADLQEQLKEAVKDMGFKYIRFHGIFSDEMRVVGTNRDGEYEFNWNYVDKVIDFFQSIDLKPFFDFTFMPKELSSSQNTMFWYKGNISKPKDLKVWTKLVESFISHCINRYGLEEVRQWYFEIWNEPDYMWAGTQEEYFELYKATVEAILSKDEDLKIAGPAIMHKMDLPSSWLQEFINFINDNKLRLECFTYHIYGEKNMHQRTTGEIIPILGGKDHVKECVDFYQQQLEKFNIPVKEVHITEFNLSARHGNYLLDTMFAACFIIYNALKNKGKLNSLGFWNISDIFEEDDFIQPVFSGGFGMITSEGIKKPSYYAYYFLSCLGNEVLQEGDDYIITRKGEDIQILAFNYVFYDRAFQNGDNSLLSFRNRYDVFEEKTPIDLNIKLTGLKGAYLIKEQLLDRTAGSAFDIYEAMGHPEELGSLEVEYLKAMARPQIKVREVQVEDEFVKNIDLKPHGIAFITIKKKY
ncbi:MAG: helix-turn-helix domain-containing protein [Clostridium sp.]